MLLSLDIGNKEENLNVLIDDIKKSNNHFDVGMFGFQYLFNALSQNKKDELICKMICNEEPPSFKVWIDKGATSFYETFGETWSLSMNHHMFTSIIQYLK